MRPHFTKLIASILLGVFSVFLIPKEFVHALYGHKDTQEIVCIGNENAVSTHHTHCEFLTYEASLFTLGSATTCPVSIEHAFAFATIQSEQSGIVFSNFPSLRGPPAKV